MIKKVGAPALIALVLLMFPSTVSAAKLAIAPSELKITDALRGGEYERTVAVFADENANITFRIEGVAREWISLYKLDNLTTPVEKISIGEEGRSYILVRVKVPLDISNGIYAATVNAETVPVEIENVEAGVVLRAKMSITIEVTGTQVLAGVVEYITTSDTEVNFPLRIRVKFRNTGNVIAKPEINTAITKNGTFIDNFTHADTEIKVGAADIISVEWDTTGKENGDYVANVTVSLGGEVLAAENLQFKLLPTGTLSRRGELTELKYEGEPLVGRTIKILATFRNTGEIDTRAKLVGEVYVDDEFTDAVASEELSVPTGETAALTAYLKIERPGSYVIKGHVIYDGKTTDAEELSFEVGDGSKSTIFLGATVAAIMIASVTGYMITIRKKAGLRKVHHGKSHHKKTIPGGKTKSSKEAPR